MSSSYETKRDEFIKLLNEQSNLPNGSRFEALPGRKYDKVYVWSDVGSHMGRYMIDRTTKGIYGIKSWAMVNPRRFYGDLDTIDQWDWSSHYATPLANTPAYVLNTVREERYKSVYKKRGRPRKAAKISSTP
jgi:hypothetical protein